MWSEGRRRLPPGMHVLKIEADYDQYNVNLSQRTPSPRDLQSEISEDSLGGEMRKPVNSKGIEEELCLICGDRASGYHYNALSCEGCKGFFRRSISRGAFYQCKYGSNCEMDMWMRRRCQACRLRRCRDVGMKEECLLSERQCNARNVRRQYRQKVKAGGKSGVSHRGLTTKRCQIETSVADFDTLERSMCHSPLDQLSTEHRELISMLVMMQDKYELPSPEDLSKLTDLNVSESTPDEEVADGIFIHMVEMTILVTRLVVEFAKHLPGFQNLAREDQIILLKGSASEVMMLRTARRYDPQTNTVVFGNGQPFTADSMSFGGLQGYVDLMFEFSRGMSGLEVDNTEYALVTAICIFSERPGVTNWHAAEKLQSVYTDALIAYTTHRRLAGTNILAKLLMKLVDLRTLSFQHSQVLYNLKVEKGSLPPLLSEYFNISE